MSSGDGGAGGSEPGGSATAGTAAITSAAISASATTLGNTESLVVTFDGSVDTGSLSVSGTLAAEATGTWSSTVVQNDTYTLAPVSGSWRAGPGRTVSVSAQGAHGGTAAASASYVVHLTFDPLPAAATVIGHGDFTTASAEPTSAHSFGISSPTSVAASPAGRIFITDTVNSRVLGFSALPSTPGANADIVLGQPDFTSSTAGTSQSKFSSPWSISIGGGKMAVADRGAHRVLIYNSIPSSSSALPDVVVGQPDFTSSTGTCTATGLTEPTAVMLTDDGKLLVAESWNNRVLVWNSVPATNGKAADVVIGQSSFSNCAANDDNQDGATDTAPSARTIQGPAGVWSDGHRLVVADSGNQRVLLWSSLPTANFAPANVVIGQSSFTRAAGNDDNQDGATDSGPTARTFASGDGGGVIAVQGDQLAVVDVWNSRVLLWNRFPTSNFAPADAVIGKPDFTTGGSFPPASDRTLVLPWGLTFSQDKLLVVDIGAQRVLGFTSK